MCRRECRRECTGHGHEGMATRQRLLVSALPERVCAACSNEVLNTCPHTCPCTCPWHMSKFLSAHMVYRSLHSSPPRPSYSLDPSPRRSPSLMARRRVSLSLSLVGIAERSRTACGWRVSAMGNLAPRPQRARPRCVSARVSIRVSLRLARGRRKARSLVGRHPTQCRQSHTANMRIFV